MKSIRDFIYKEFFLKQVVWLAWSLFALFFILTSVQIGYGIKANQEKIENLIEFNKDEIFSSIVLGDTEALKEHLEIIKKQYELNYVELSFNDVKIETETTPILSYFKWVKIFSPRCSTTYTNEFKTVTFKAQVDFTNIIINDTLIPFIRTSILIYAVLIFVIYLFFNRQTKIVQRDIISPMSLLVKQIQNDKFEETPPQSHLSELNILSEAIQNYPKLKRESVIGELASQVAHDIRSPLEALKASKKEINLLPELDRQSINLAINRIEEISYQLLKMRKTNTLTESQNIHLLPALEQLIQEKRMQYRSYSDLKIELEEASDSYSIFISMESNTLKSIISNLVTNSVEAIEYKGTVKVYLRATDGKAIITVHDTGKGFNAEFVGQYFQKGFTTKKNGNGLGLYNAKKELEAVGGKISLSPDQDATISLEIPCNEAPSIFLTEINVSNIKKLIVLDDDVSVHNIWEKRFSGINVIIEHYYKAEDLLRNYTQIAQDELLLSDYELLGENINGLECIKQLASYNRSILVTARWDEKIIVNSCLNLGIKLLPKNMANKIAIKSKLPSRPEIVLIDDDKLIHFSWKRAARSQGISLHTFYSIEEFLSESQNIALSTPIYLDSNLGDGIKGEIDGEAIHQKGYSEIFLATGYEACDLAIPHWIKSCHGKGFPDL